MNEGVIQSIEGSAKGEAQNQPRMCPIGAGLASNSGKMNLKRRKYEHRS